MLNRKMSRKGLEIVNGEIVLKETTTYKKAATREVEKLSIIANKIRNRKKVSKDKALKLAKIKLNDMLGKGRDKTSFMSMAFSEEEQQVGRLTAQMSIICSLTKAAWCKEDGSIDLELFYAAFKCCDKKNPGVNDHWESIFDNSVSLTKELRLSNFMEMTYNVYYISNIEILRFKNQLEGLDPTKITYEDIVAIQSDLYHLFRAFQESSIDVVKDKKKQYKIKWDDIIGTVPKIYSKHQDDYRHNIDAVIADKTVKYDIEINSKDDAKQTRGDVLCDALLETHINFVQEEILATAEDSITELMQGVIGTSDDLDTEAKLHAESIISVVAASFKSENSLDREEYRAIRNALYTIAAEEAETAEEATAMVLDLIAAKYTIDHRGNLNRNYDISKIRLGTAKMILGGILPLYLNDRSTYTKVFSKQEYCLFQELEDGQRFSIEDNDIIADGMIVGALRNDEDAELVSDAAYVVDGDLYVECDIYADLDCEVQTVVLDTLYLEAPIQDVVAGKADDNLGRDAYVALCKANEITITGKKHNIVAADGVIRARLNDYSVLALEGQNTLEITPDNTIAVHIPYDKEVDKYEYCCEVIVFC